MPSLAEAERTVHRWPPDRLTVVYDDTCELCRRCRHWLAAQPCHVELQFLATSSPAARQRYGATPWYGTELLVVDDTGRGWIGADAFLMCLWATRRWRSMSFRLRGGAFAPLAERFFNALSANRSTVSGLLRSHHCDDGSCRTAEPTVNPTPGPAPLAEVVGAPPRDRPWPG